MDAQLNCETCGATFHRYNLKQKYCSATCRNKALYANRKHQLAKVEQLFSIAEELARSEERVKQLEEQLKDLKEENEALRATIQQLAAQPTPSRYHIELRKMSITQALDQPFRDFYLDQSGNKTISTDTIYLSTYSNNGALLSEQEIKGNDELFYLMERHNITDIELSAGSMIFRGVMKLAAQPLSSHHGLPHSLSAQFRPQFLNCPCSRADGAKIPNPSTTMIWRATKLRRTTAFLKYTRPKSLCLTQSIELLSSYANWNS